MAVINPHINFNGNAEEAFNFYKSVFGGAFAKVIRFKDLSSAEFPVAEHEADKIMHIALPIGPNMLLANDVPEILGRINENENRSKISISAIKKMRIIRYYSTTKATAQLPSAGYLPMGERPMYFLHR